MGTVVRLKKQINNSYYDLRNSVEGKLILVEEKINSKLNWLGLQYLKYWLFHQSSYQML